MFVAEMVVVLQQHWHRMELEHQLVGDILDMEQLQLQLVVVDHWWVQHRLAHIQVDTHLQLDSDQELGILVQVADCWEVLAY